MWTLMRMSSIGLVPYPSERDFLMSYPNKSIEYLSAGLPIVTSLDGLLSELIARHDCGVSYPNRDVSALVQVLVELAADRARLARMASNALGLYQREFVEEIYAAMADHLERLARSAQARSAV
jgi:glycosyltransferase involved in cell wall biosynthesis